MCSRLFLWLYEYLERLETGVYAVTPTDHLIINTSARTHVNNTDMDTAENSDHICRRINLFPCAQTILSNSHSTITATTPQDTTV